MIRRSSFLAPLILAAAACTDAGPSPTAPEPTAPAAAVVTELAGAQAEGFEIELWGRWQDSAFLEMAPAIQTARARWEKLLAPSDPWAVDAGLMYCPGVPGTTARIMGEIDDIAILFQRVRIDGEGGTLAQAGACVVWSRGFLPPFGPATFEYLPVYGIVQVDDADVDDLLARGQLEDIMLHEIGHALGMGSHAWSLLGLVADARPPGSVLFHDTHFTGPRAVEAFKSIANGYDGAMVPVDNRGLTYTAHWRESVMGNELMSPTIQGGTALSLVTAAALEDIGYTVSRSAVDRYAPLAGSVAMDVGAGLPLGDDVLPVSPLLVDPQGRLRPELDR